MAWFKNRSKYKHKQHSESEGLPLKIMFQGQREAGKSSVMSELENGKFQPDMEQLGGMNVHSVFEGTEVQTWNFSRRMLDYDLRELYKECDGVVCVIDSTDKENLEEAIMEMGIFVIHPLKKFRAKVMLVLVNKQDVEGALPFEIIEEKVKKLVLTCERRMEGKSVFVAGCSAKTREGLDKAFSLLLKEIQNKKTETTENEKTGNRFLQKLADVPFIKCLLFH